MQAQVRPPASVPGAHLAERVTASGVPMLVVDDSAQIAVHAAGLGLLDATAVAAIRAEQP